MLNVGKEVAALSRMAVKDLRVGNLMPRERLVEDVLMQRFSAKRHTVRQALVELERMGIVTRTPNRGAAVRDFTALEVEEIAEVRATLHRRAAQRMKLPADAARSRATLSSSALKISARSSGLGRRSKVLATAR